MLQSGVDQAGWPADFSRVGCVHQTAVGQGCISILFKTLCLIFHNSPLDASNSVDDSPSVTDVFISVK